MVQADDLNQRIIHRRALVDLTVVILRLESDLSGSPRRPRAVCDRWSSASSALPVAFVSGSRIRAICVPRAFVKV